MKFLMQVLLALGFFIHTISAVELPDFTVLAEEQGNKVVNISSIVERVNNQNNIPFQDERMQEFFKKVLIKPISCSEYILSFSINFFLSHLIRVYINVTFTNIRKKCVDITSM